MDAPSLGGSAGGIREKSAPAAAVFVKEDPVVGRLWLRPLRLPEDLTVVHAWVSRSYASYWGLVGRSLEQVREAYLEIGKHATVYLGFRGEAPAFLVERYAPATHEVGQHYEVETGDQGMHLLVAPPDMPLPGFTWAVFKTVMDFLFVDPAVHRVVVEPDVRNEKIRALNRRAGFREQRVLALSNKTAQLAFCTRQQYRAALTLQERGLAAALRPSREHLEPQVWAEVNAALVRKAIAELAHERLLSPQPVGESYVLTSDSGVEYRFFAQLLPLEHWLIDPASLVRTVQGAPTPLDALDFVIEFAADLGLSPANLPVYLEEVASTLHSAAYRRTHQRHSSAELVHADFQAIEAAMTEGHPAFIANSGRVGFDAADQARYAPEAAAPTPLVWLAARRAHTEVSCAAGLSYEQLIADELGPDTLQEFRAQLRVQGLEPDEYELMPVHPWQWYEKLALLFAAELANRDLVCLGFGPDHYRAQQSIRTFFNVSAPRRHYIKTALSILNMGFLRGLSADYMRGTPAINDWLGALVEGDPFLAGRRFRLLREVAAIGYRKATFEAALPKASPFRKMAAALFRESPLPKLRPQERCMTMAALLHRDRAGAALLPRLIQASGLDIDTWLARYFAVYLAPLIHCFYRHDLAFMPHGENVILVLEEQAPVAIFIKDLAEEAAILDPDRPLPALVRRLAVAVPDDLKLLCIFTDIFDGFLRFVSALLVEEGYGEARFWERVAACILDYQAAHPELAERFERYDLFAPRFAHSCLNRLQLRNNRHMLDLADPVKGLAFAGALVNPIARYSPSGQRS